jgi:hypothetical protein
MRDWYREGINWKLREAPIRPLPLSPVEKAWLSVGVILAMITLYTTVGLAWHLL